MAKKEMNGYGGHRTMIVLSGLVLIALGVFWWMGRLTLEKTFALLLIGWGLKKLYWAYRGDCC